MWLRALPHGPKLGSKSNRKTSKGGDVANRDLWEALLGEIEKAKERNMAVQFRKIPKEWNVDAHDAAMKATEQPAADSFQDQI